MVPLVKVKNHILSRMFWGLLFEVMGHQRNDLKAVDGHSLSVQTDIHPILNKTDTMMLNRNMRM